MWDSTSGKGSLEDISQKKAVHEAKILNLDISKAKFKLGWQPKLNIEETIEYTIQ